MNVHDVQNQMYQNHHVGIIHHRRWISDVVATRKLGWDLNVEVKGMTSEMWL